VACWNTPAIDEHRSKNAYRTLQARRQVRLAGAAFAHQHYGFGALDVAAFSQIANLRRRNLPRLVKVFLVVIDEYTRECLALRVARRLGSLQVIDTLADVMLVRGIPAHIRSDL
jgi:hypothetical protein